MRVLRGGGGERHRGHRSVIHAGDVSGAVEWRQIKLKISCDVPAPLNQRRTTITRCFLIDLPFRYRRLLKKYSQEFFVFLFFFLFFISFRAGTGVLMDADYASTPCVLAHEMSSSTCVFMSPLCATEVAVVQRSAPLR